VNPLRPLFGPVSSDGERIIAKDRLLPVIALPQPDAFASPQVDGRKYLHRKTSFS
jgi:hypothetical protein